MGSATWTVTVAGWLAIVAGAALTVLAVTAFVFTNSRGSTAVAGGPIIFGIIIAPLLALAGILVIVCGVKLMGGHVWARMTLEILAWTSLAVIVGWSVYDLSQMNALRVENVIPYLLGFLAGGVPALLMIVLLHSAGVSRALVR